MEKAIKVINEMLAEGLFSHYAIGGGIATLFYIEPVTTFDLDVFIILADSPGKLISLSPLYSWLGKRGCKPHKEQVIIEGIPVQFIPAYNDLIVEAVQGAHQKAYGSTSTFVISPEHLAAIMIQTSRQKDKERLARLLDESKISRKKLESIISNHHLSPAFKEFERYRYGKKT